MKYKISKTDEVNYADEVIKKIKENDGYCPCKLTKTEDTKCMCKEFREQQEGLCDCGLYYKTLVND